MPTSRYYCLVHLFMPSCIMHKHPQKLQSCTKRLETAQPCYLKSSEPAQPCYCAKTINLSIIHLGDIFSGMCKHISLCRLVYSVDEIYSCFSVFCFSDRVAARDVAHAALFHGMFQRCARWQIMLTGVPRESRPHGLCISCTYILQSKQENAGSFTSTKTP